MVDGGWRTGDEQRLRLLFVVLLPTRVAELDAAIDARVALLHLRELQLVAARSTREEVRVRDCVLGNHEDVIISLIMQCLAIALLLREETRKRKGKEVLRFWRRCYKYMLA